MTEGLPYCWASIETPLGSMRAIDAGGALYGLYFTDAKDCPAPVGSASRTPLIDALEEALTAYFKGERQAFRVPLFERGTVFQGRAWSTLLSVPFGTSVSYGELAKWVGSPKAARAIGAAVGANPWVLIVPCHRVLARGEALGGFSSGLARKRWLLAHEGIAWRD